MFRTRHFLERFSKIKFLTPQKRTPKGAVRKWAGVSPAAQRSNGFGPATTQSTAVPSTPARSQRNPASLVPPIWWPTHMQHVCVASDSRRPKSDHTGCLIIPCPGWPLPSLFAPPAFSESTSPPCLAPDLCPTTLPTGQ